MRGSYGARAIYNIPQEKRQQRQEKGVDGAIGNSRSYSFPQTDTESKSRCAKIRSHRAPVRSTVSAKRIAASALQSELGKSERREAHLKKTSPK